MNDAYAYDLLRSNRFWVGLWVISTQTLSLVLRIKSSASRERCLIENWYGLGTLHKIDPSRKLQKVKSVKVSPTNRRKIFVSRLNHVPIFIDWFFNVKCWNQASHCYPYGWECHVPARTNPTRLGFSVSTDGHRNLQTYRLPNPQHACAGSLTSLFSFPSFIKRSGLNMKRSGYTLLSCSIALSINLRFVIKACYERLTMRLE